MKVTKVVHSDEVEELTRAGWVLVCTHANAQRIAVESVRTKPSGYDVHNNWHPDVYENVHSTVVDPLFVLEKDSETLGREAQLEQMLEYERNALREHEEKLLAFEKSLKSVGEAFETEKELRTRAEQRRDHAEAALSAERANLYKLEGHLAKVRKEIGEARWREVVGE